MFWLGNDIEQSTHGESLHYLYILSIIFLSISFTSSPPPFLLPPPFFLPSTLVVYIYDIISFNLLVFNMVSPIKAHFDFFLTLYDTSSSFRYIVWWLNISCSTNSSNTWGCMAGCLAITWTCVPFVWRTQVPSLSSEISFFFFLPLF